MGIEIERKFIVKDLQWMPKSIVPQYLRQGYLSVTPQRTVRIRLLDSSGTITIKGETNFKNTAKDALITTQLRTALIFKKNIKATNYNIDTINGKIYIFGISMESEEKRSVIKEAQEIYGVKEVIPSIILVDELSRNKN